MAANTVSSKDKIPATGCDRPALKSLNKHVIKHVSFKWHDLGLELLEQEDEGKLKQIKSNNSDNVEECCKEMFQLWLEKYSTATWNQLIQALKEVDLNNLATEVEGKLMDTAPVYTSQGASQLNQQVTTTVIDQQLQPLVKLRTTATLPCASTSENQNEIWKRKPNMRDLTKIVIPRIMNQWEYVAEALYYDLAVITDINKKKGSEGSKQCCREFFKDWLTSKNGANAGPKVWLTLINALKEVDDISIDIVEDIVKEVIQLKCD